MPSSAPARSPVLTESVPSGNPLWAIPVRSLSATRERPLFAPTRRPPPPVVAYQPVSAPPPPPKPAEPETPRLSLVGTIAAGAEGIGLFLDPANGSAVLRLKTGEAHNGWVLREVRRREATLQKGFQIAVLKLPRPDLSKPTLPTLQSAPASTPQPLKPQANLVEEAGDKSSAAPPSAPPVNAPLALPIANESLSAARAAAPAAFPAPVFPIGGVDNSLMDRRRGH